MGKVNPVLQWFYIDDTQYILVCVVIRRVVHEGIKKETLPVTGNQASWHLMFLIMSTL